MSLAIKRKNELVAEFKTHESDSGSPEVQVSILTERIRELTGHLKEHHHDFSSRRGLLQMVSRRNRLLRYLSRIDRDRYQTLIKRLGLRK